MEKFWQKRVWIPQAISILMLFWALYPDNPYGYYRLLRVIVVRSLHISAFMR